MLWAILHVHYEILLKEIYLKMLSKFKSTLQQQFRTGGVLNENKALPHYAVASWSNRNN